MLGQPRFVTEPGGKVELGGAELELLARLALDPGRTFSGEELRADIGAGKKTDWAASTLWTRASSLRKVVGTEHVPLSSKTGGYHAVGISTDVARFEAALAGSRTDAGAVARHLAEALSLVRSAPFDNVPAGTFSWASEGGGVGRRLGNKVYDAAVELALPIASKDRGPRPVGYLQGGLIVRGERGSRRARAWRRGSITRTVRPSTHLGQHEGPLPRQVGRKCPLTWPTGTASFETVAGLSARRAGPRCECRGHPRTQLA